MANQLPSYGFQTTQPTVSFGNLTGNRTTPPPAYTPPPPAQPPPIPQSEGNGSMYNDPRLQQAQDAYTASATQANQAQSSEFTLPAMLKQALQKKFADNPLIGTREAALKDYMDVSGSQSSVLPENNNGVIFNPNQQADLLNKRNNAALAPLATQNYLIDLQQGGIPDILNAAAGAARAQTQSLTGKADIARTQYKDILDELSKKADEAFKQKDDVFKMQELDLKKQELQQKLVDQEKLTSAQKAKSNNFEAALKGLDMLNSDALKKGGPIEGRKTNLFKNIMPSLANKDLAQFQSDIGPLRDSILNAISGANVSAAEADRILAWVPDITKSYEENQRNLKSLRSWLTNNYETITGQSYNGKGVSGGSTSDSDPLGIL